MSVVVKKFGGTSVANIERIEFIAEKLFEFYKQRQKVVVVVSAMQGETDRLESLAYKISSQPDLRELAALLATGEQITIALLAMALIKRGCPARSYTGLQLGIETTGLATNARIKNINLHNLAQALDAGELVIVAGFQGVDLTNGNITTLGRGGSDTTAVALAVALQAKECHIYTDVEGVYTADPNLVPEAKQLASINFTEMLELSGLGAKVMQIRAVELGSYYNLPIRVLSSFHKTDLAGTIISGQDHYLVEAKEEEQRSATSSGLVDVMNLQDRPTIKLAALRGQIKVLIQNIKLEQLEKILQDFAILQIDLDMLHWFGNTNINHDVTGQQYRVSFILSNKYLEKCQAILYAAKVALVDVSYVQFAKLSLVGLGLASNPMILSKVFASLRQAGLMIEQIITSEIKVSTLLNEIDLELAMKTLHTALIGEAITVEGHG